MRELGRRIPIVPRHTKIRNLDLSAIVHQDVGGLEISMQDPIAVEVLDGGGELEKERLDLGGEERLHHVFL